MMSQLQQRLLVSTFGITILVTSIYWSYTTYGIFLFAILTAAIFSSAVWEYYNIAQTKGVEPLVTMGSMYSVAYVFATFLSINLNCPMVLPGIVLVLMLLNGFLFFFFTGRDPFVNLAITLFPIGYLILPLSCMIKINFFFQDGIQDGRWWLLYLLFVTKTTDAGAYFIGKLVGRRKMTTYISPKKTWEGAIGGFLTAIFLSLCFWIFAQTTIAMELTFIQSVGLGCSIGVLAQLGDLAESLLKRDVGVKDSSRIPGLGGMLDIVDSLVFTSPMLYLFLKLGSV